MQKQRLHVIIGTAVTFTAAALAMAAPAAAAPQVRAPIPCPANDVCMYENVDFGGQIYKLHTEDKKFSDNLCPDCHPPGNWDNRMSSIINNKSTRYCFYEKDNFGGADIKVEGHQRMRSLPGFNDKISSARSC